MKHIAVLTSGGDAPGMNAAIRAVTRSALDQGMTVYGVRQGWQGLVDGQFRELSARDVGGIIQVGGTFLGSARSAEFREERGRSKALRNLAQRGIDGVVVIGGNGSQTGSYMLSQLGVHVVGIASTIDNDLLGTDVSIGSDTAINVTLEAIDHLRTTGSSHNRAFLVETMGRDCGYLAMMAGLAGGAEVISTPEFEVPASEIARRLHAAYERGKTHAIVVIAEGVKENAAKEPCDRIRNLKCPKDFGQVRVGEMILCRDQRRQDGEGLAADVIDNRRKEQRPNNPPTHPSKTARLGWRPRLLRNICWIHLISQFG